MLEKLRELWRAAFQRCENIRTKAGTENRAYTVEERTALDTDMKAMDDLDADIKREESLQARAEAANATRADQVFHRPGAAATVHDNAEDKPFASLGEQLRSIQVAATSRREQLDPRLRRYDLSDVNVRAAAGMSEGVGGDGGFLVGTDQGAFIEKQTFETGILAARCSDLTISSNSNGIKMPCADETSRANGSRWGGVQAYWNSEAGALTGTKPKFGQISLTLNKLTALSYVTDELLMDATALETYVTRSVTDELAFKLDDAIVRGSGAGVPLGVLTAPCTVSVAKETSQVASTIVMENATKMMARMLPRSFDRAIWVINVDCIPTMMNMTVKVKNVAGTENVGGSAVWIPPGGISGSPYGSLYGRPVITSEHAETAGTVGDIMLLDLGMYWLARKGGIQSASSIHVNFLTDETAYRFIMRIDGQPMLKSAITPYKGSGTLSSFITLQTRS